MNEEPDWERYEYTRGSQYEGDPPATIHAWSIDEAVGGDDGQMHTMDEHPPLEEYNFEDRRDRLYEKTVEVAPESVCGEFYWQVNFWIEGGGRSHVLPISTKPRSWDPTTPDYLDQELVSDYRAIETLASEDVNVHVTQVRVEGIDRQNT